MQGEGAKERMRSVLPHTVTKKLPHVSLLTRQVRPLAMLAAGLPLFVFHRLPPAHPGDSRVRTRSCESAVTHTTNNKQHAKSARRVCGLGRSGARDCSNPRAARVCLHCSCALLPALASLPASCLCVHALLELGVLRVRCRVCRACPCTLLPVCAALLTTR